MLLLTAATARAQSNEFRAFWADAWGSELWTTSAVSQVISDLRAGNCNALVAQTRRRGDALYQSHFEPLCDSISPGFDPLGELIAQAHNTNNGPRIEIHAWLVTYHVWQSNSVNPLPPQPDHPLNLHPDWLLKDIDGRTLIGKEYSFDPGHPEVQKHTFNVAMDIITNYDVDGLNFDYIRYAGANEGYNDVTVARFQRLFNRTDVPSAVDAVWKQFRRDQVTALLRKVYLNAIALKPRVKISCDTITWSPSPTNDASWYSSSAAWNSIFQDWRGWMEEGILDLNIPMSYFRQTQHAQHYTNWGNFIKDHRFSRQAVIGPGIYLNSIADSLVQMRQTRALTAAGNRADGTIGYSYRVTNKDDLPRATFLNALVQPSAYDPVTPPIFAGRVPTPVMPWKTTPTNGHLKGFIYGGSLANPLDGAVVTLTGPANRAQTNDATGFYGFVDLAPGTYTVAASFPGYPDRTNTVPITAGVVATLDLLLGNPPSICTQPQSQTALLGQSATFSVSAEGAQPLSYQWRVNGNDIPGATDASFTLFPVQSIDSGFYSVLVTNALGALASSNAQLVVTAVGAWGDNSWDQNNVPLSATNVIAIAGGTWHSLALRADGTVVAWGDDWVGQCAVPASLSNVLAIAAGGGHSLALKADGIVVAWGDNEYGQTDVPAGLRQVIAIAAGTGHSLALRLDGTVVAWGDDTFGQCSVPADLSQVVAIATGGNHSLALRADGTVVAWGENTDAQGSYAGQSAVPPGLSDVVALAAGDFHSLAVRANGTLVAWGDNSEGQCDVPSGLTNVVAVTGGGAHSLALRADGTVVTWGANWSGQCSLAPALSDVIGLGAGAYHSLVLTAGSLPELRLLSPEWQGSRFSALVQTVYRRSYALECKDSLTTSNWTVLSTNAGNGSLKLLNDPAAEGSQRYYRLRQW